MNKLFCEKIMATIIILGAGKIGAAIALDWVGNYSIACVDYNRKSLKSLKQHNAAIQTIHFDLEKASSYDDLLAPYDLVINAVSGYIGYETLKRILQAKKNVIDASFFPENCFDLDYLAKKNKVYAVVDCGVAPGMDNIILGYLDTQMNVYKFECLVGGLPSIKTWPFNYKSLFSPIDVIQEYTRPARYIENGDLVIKPALSDCELMNIQKIGTLEAFNTDGLRTLIKTMAHIPSMKEKTLRYPGHCEYIQVLQQSGFFSCEPLTLNGIEFTPMSITAKMLEAQWKLNQYEEEFTVMRITIEGEKNGKHKRYVYRMLDKTGKGDLHSSMARTNAYTATAVATFLMQRPLSPGIFAPETLGALEGVYPFVMNYLKERNIFYNIQETTLSI
jgi:saccharopine dehydrogenase-like NADP-dependent oxidoreductase